MSFFASNDRIHITNTQGQTIFDTSKPMPHVIGRIQPTVSVTFPNIPGTAVKNVNTFPNHQACQYLSYETVCGYQNVQSYEYVCENQYVCGFQYTPNGTEYVCSWQNVCSWKWVTKNQYVCESQWVTRYGDGADMLQWYEYTAHEWSQIINLGPVPNNLNSDFLLVNATASQNTQGQVIDIGFLPCGLPLNQNFSANNSCIVETISDVSNGDPWLTRTMSIYVESGQIKCEFRHSNRFYKTKTSYSGLFCSNNGVPAWIPNKPSSVPESSSSYIFNFDILIGKFTL